MNKKHLITAALCCLSSIAAQAGGLMTNTNYHIAFDRMFARGATTEIDATFSNPAGLVWGNEGFEMSLNFQKPWQNRDIYVDVDVDVDPSMVPDFSKADFPSKKYEGKASAPIVPALFAVYHKDRWAVSGMIGIVGSGGFVEYEDGVPMFNVPVTAMTTNTVYNNMLAALTVQGNPNASAIAGALSRDFSLNSSMKGKQYIYGGQVNFSYKILDCLSAAVGLRANYYDGYYKGYVTAMPGETLGAVAGIAPLMDMQLSCIQRGWGFTPVVGLNLHKDKWTVAVKYEFRTKMNMENKSTVKEAHAIDAVNVFRDGTSIREDQPSLLAFGVQYTPVECVRINAGYHHFYDKAAKKTYYKMNEAGVSTRYDNKNDMLDKGTNEYLGGAEWDITKKLTASAGFQITRYGNTDEYINDISFVVDSWSYGLGVKYQVTDKIAVNAAYFKTCYDDYTTAVDANGVQNSFTRSNRVGAIGVDIKF